MKNSILIFCFLCFWSKNTAQSFSPKVIANAGRYIEVNAVRYAYTIGEPLILTSLSSGNPVTFGFNQPETIINAVLEVGGQKLEIDYAPNPATDYIFVSVKENMVKDLSVALSDIEGRIVHTYPLSIGTQSLQFSTATIANGLYFLQVIDAQKKIIHSFKVVVQH
jgi:hypothetical protein